MPNVQTHDKIATATAALIIPSTQYITMQLDHVYLPLHDSIFLAAMLIICNHYLSPDLDIISQPFYRWGKLKLIWLPYQRLIKHRSWLSHSGPISFTLRIIYLFFPLIVLWCFFPLPISEYVQYYVVLFWIAGSIADLVHSLADWITSI